MRRGDETPTSGVRNIPTEELQALAEKADGKGLQIAIHAIGDLAVEEVSKMYQAYPRLLLHTGLEHDAIA